MKRYTVRVNEKAWEIPATSARVAINKVLRSLVGTRTADKMIPLHIDVTFANYEILKQAMNAKGVSPRNPE
jgi:hypothetical protein